MNIVQFCLIITGIFFVISVIVDISDLQAVIRGKRVNVYNNNGQKVRNIKPDGGTYIGLSLLFDLFLFVCSVGMVLVYKYTLNWWALLGTFIVGYAGCGVINKRIYNLPDLEPQKEEKKMATFKIPTGKELDDMLNQLSDEDKRKIAEAFEKDVQKEDQQKKQTEKESEELRVQEDVEKYTALTLGHTFSPVSLQQKLGCDRLTMYHVINKLADQGKINIFLQLECPKCGKLMDYQGLEDISDTVVCPKCGEKIEDPALKVDLLCKKIDNSSKIVDVVNQLQPGETIFPVDLAHRLSESIENVYKTLEQLTKQHKLTSFLQYQCPHCGHFIDYPSIADIPEKTHCSECGSDSDNHEVLHKAILLYRKLK